MPRSGRVKKKPLSPDPIYNNQKVTRLVNKVMKDGKKQTAYKHVYGALKIVEKKLKKKDPVPVFLEALENIKPKMEVRSRRVGGSAYQVPIPVKGDRQEALAIRWLVNFARRRPNKEFPTYTEKLAAEIIDAYQNKGGAVSRKQEVHRMAEANKAFAHFRW